MKQAGRGDASIFQRNSRKTILVLFLAAAWILDFGAAQILFTIGERYRQRQASYRTRSPIYHHELKPNMTVPEVFWGPTEFTAVTNSLGFRDREVRTVPPSSDRYRVLFMGDSFTEAVGVDYDESFVGLVGERLKSDGVEVLNGAAVSYSPAIYFRKTKELLENRGLRFDQMVVFMDISDTEDEVSYDFDQAGNVVRTDQGGTAARPIDWRKLAKENSMLLQGASIAREWLRPPLPAPWPPEDTRCTWTFDAAAFESFGRRGLERGAANMDRLLALLRAHQIPLSLVVYPWPCQMRVGDLNSRQVEFWGDWASRNDVRFLSLFSDFIPESAEARATIYRHEFVRGDVHWTKEGHKRVADRFLESGLLVIPDASKKTPSPH